MTRMVYAAVALAIALVLASIILFFIPEADECPGGTIAKFRWTGWICNDVSPP
jgi:hypothetical protein